MCFETCFESYFETCRGARCTNVYSDELEFGTPVLPECPIILTLPEGGGKPTSMALEVGSIITIFRHGLMIHEFVVQVDEKVS